MAHPNPPIDEEYMDYISINFEDILDLEEMNVDSVHLVGLLIVNQEPSQIIVNIKVQVNLDATKPLSYQFNYAMPCQRKAIILEWGNLDHLKSFGTHYRNGTLTLTIMSFH
ncbi:hypothetical protein ACFX13_015308 [Malus domestica]